MKKVSKYNYTDCKKKLIEILNEEIEMRNK